MIFGRKNQDNYDDNFVEFNNTIEENYNFDNLDDESKKELEKVSDEDYRKITSKIVNVSSDQLKNQNESKTSLKKILINFFKTILIIQMSALLIMVLLKGFIKSFDLSDSVLISLITSMFVETLGGIITMVKYAFNSSQEVEILNILNSVIQNYQKYHKG